MKTHLVTLTVPLSALTSPHQPLPVIQLLPDGEFSARDGRPGSLTGGSLSVWTLSPAVASALLERWHGRTTPLVVDYEHQSLNTRQNGQPAPAAGWIESLGYTAGQGLFASVHWTDGAVAFIERDEYRYISPVFSFDPQTGAVLELQGVALTNTPALDGLAVVATSEDLGDVPGIRNSSSLLTPAATGVVACPEGNGKHPKTEIHMNILDRLKALFGLPKTATEEEVLAELDKLESLLSPESDAKNEAAKGQAALAHNIESALADGRLTRGLLGWARNLGTCNPSALKDYLEASVPLAALTSSQTDGRKELFGGASHGVSALSEEERFVCDQLGINEESYLSQRQSQRQTHRR